MRGIGLAHRETITPAHRGQQRQQAEGCQQRARRRLRLIGAYREPPPCIFQSREPFGNAWVRFCRHTGIRPIIVEECIEDVLAFRVTARRERPAHQSGCAVAHEVPYLGFFEALQPATPEHAVEARGEIGKRVDERAIEIKEQGWMREHAGGTSRLRRPVKPPCVRYMLIRKMFIEALTLGCRSRYPAWT